MKFFLTISFLLSNLLVTGDELELHIKQAMEAGSAQEIGVHFFSQVELTIVADDDIYSNTQAELILKKFFKTNIPKSFKIIHKGTSKDGAKYFIGMLDTDNKTFRCYFLFKQHGQEFLIHQLRVEEE